MTDLLKIKHKSNVATKSIEKDSVPWVFAFLLLLLFVGRNVFNKPVLACFLVLYLPLAVYKFRYLAAVFSNSLIVFGFYVFFGLSYFWSVTPLVTLDIIFVQFSFVLLALFLSVTSQVTGFSGPLRTASVFLLAFIVAFAVAFPKLSTSSAGFVAFYMQKNGLGAMAAVCCLTLFFAPMRRWYHLAIFGIAIAVLVASRSKTSIALVGLFLIFIPFLEILKGAVSSSEFNSSVFMLLRRVLFWSLIVLFSGMIVFSDEFVDLVWNNLSKTALTGRGVLWLTVIQQLRGDTLLGIGPGSFWQAGWGSEIARTTAFMNDPNWIQRMVAADGSYIDLFASLGIVGLVFFLATAVDLYRRLFRNWDKSDSKLIFALVSFVLLHGVTESTILYSTNILWLIYLLCYFRVAGYGEKDVIPASRKNTRPLVCW